MEKSKIEFEVTLDKFRIPEAIIWNADDKPSNAAPDTKAVAISVWDDKNNAALNLNLWTKDMMVGEMKKFYLQVVAGLAESVKQATNDDWLFNESVAFCDKLAKHILEEEKAK